MHIWQRVMLVLVWVCVARGAQEPRWFGRQVTPKGIVRAIQDEPGAANAMLTQSIAGLAENLPQAEAWKNGGVRGYGPVTWCAQRLPKEIRVIGTEELIWRVRMKHNEAQTRAEIRKFEP